MTEITDYLIKNNFIEEKSREIYEYGLLSLFLNVSNILSILIISFYLKKTSFGFLFLLSFVPIRIILGGYHCQTALRCFFSFSAVYIFHLLILEQIKIYNISLTILICIILIILPSNVNKQKKHLLSKKYFFKKMLILIINLLILVFIHHNIIINTISISLTMNLFLYLLSKLEQSKQEL